MGATTSQPMVPLVSNDPFPMHTGATKVCRTLGTHRGLPGSGPCPMPHVPVLEPLPGRDAVGRICVEDGLGRLDVLCPDTYITMGSCGAAVEVMLQGVCMNAKLLEKRVQGGVLAFCMLKEGRLMQLHRGSFEAFSAHSMATDTFQPRHADVSGLSLEQLAEVRGRLFRSYKEYGVGVLVMNADGFTYHVLVPNREDHALHKAVYERSPSPASPVEAGGAGQTGETGPSVLVDEEEARPRKSRRLRRAPVRFRPAL